MMHLTAVRLPALFLACLLVLAAASPGRAATWIVDPGGGGHATTVAGGLALAAFGDTVLVRPGTYHENLTMKNGVRLLGDAGPAVTMLDGSDLGPVIRCSALGPATVVAGFTITHGRNADLGGGMVCVLGSSLRIAGNVFRANTARYGAAIGCGGSSSPLVEDNVFEENAATEEAGAILGNYYCSPTVRRNIFRRNVSLTRSGGALWFGDHSRPVVSDNVFVENSAAQAGGAVWLGNTLDIPFYLERNLYLRNQAGSYGGAIYGDVVYPTIRNSTFYANAAGSGSGGAVYMGVSAFMYFLNNIVSASVGTAVRGRQAEQLDCNDLWLNPDGDYEVLRPGPHDLFVDPLFCDPSHDDFTLESSSPCLDDEHCGLIGAFEAGCGPTATVPATWGALKNLYR